MIQQMQGVSSAEEAIHKLASQGYHAQKQLGTARIEKPREDWTPEQKQKWNQEVLGVPESPEQYKLENVQAPQGMSIPPEVQAEYVKSFHEAGMTDEQVSKVLNTYYDRLGKENASFQEQINATIDQNTKAMMNKWGDNYEFNVEVAEKGLEKYGSKQLIETLQANPQIMSMPEVQEIFYTLGSLEMDHELKGFNGGDLTGASKAMKLEEEIQMLESSDLWLKVLRNETTQQDKPMVDELKARRTGLHRELAEMKQKAMKNRS